MFDIINAKKRSSPRKSLIWSFNAVIWFFKIPNALFSSFLVSLALISQTRKKEFVAWPNTEIVFVTVFISVTVQLPFDPEETGAHKMIDSRVESPEQVSLSVFVFSVDIEKILMSLCTSDVAKFPWTKRLAAFFTAKKQCLWTSCSLNSENIDLMRKQSAWNVIHELIPHNIKDLQIFPNMITKVAMSSAFVEIRISIVFIVHRIWQFKYGRSTELSPILY